MVKQIQKLLVVALLVLAPGVALAQTGQTMAGTERKTFAPEGRIVEFVIPGLQVNTASVGPSQGNHGVLAALPTAAATYTRYSVTSTLGALPYPARIDIQFYDATGLNVLACTQAVVCGWDQFGYKGCETVATITEADNTTLYAYSALESVLATGCTATGTSDTNDRLVISVSDQIGLRARIARDSDVLAICVQSATTMWTRCVEGRNRTTNGNVLVAAAGDVAAAIEPEYGVIDLDDINTDGGGDFAVQDNIVTVRVWASANPITILRPR